MNATSLKRLLTKYEPDWRDPDISASHDRIVFYLELREKGNDHRFAAMLACQQAPGSRTEREFFAGRHNLDQQFRGNERQLDAVIAGAKASGFEPKANMVYEPGLAEYVGDPRAFISAAGGLTHARQQCEQRGLACGGDHLRVKGRQAERPPEAGSLAPDLVNEIITHKIQANPDLARVDRRDLVAEVQHQHGFTDAKRSGAFTEQVPHSANPAVRGAIAEGARKFKKRPSKSKRRK